MKKEIRILAVNDPAVYAYTDPRYRLLEECPVADVSLRFDIVPWERYYDTMLNAFDGEADYDIVMVAGHLWLPDLASKGFLEPLEYDPEDILPVIAREMQYGGKTYLSPSFCDGHMVVYRKSLVQRATGRLPGSVVTVPELVRTAAALKEHTALFPAALKAAPSEILLDALPYLRQDSVDLYEERSGSLVCNIEALAPGMEPYLAMKAMAPPDTETYGNEEIHRALSDRRCAMAVTWSGQLGVVMADCQEPEDMGFSTLDTAWNVTWSFGISRGSRNKNLASQVLAYLRSRAVDTVVGAYCGAPVRKGTYLAGAERYPWYGVQLSMIENYAKPLLPMQMAGEANGVLYEAVHQVFTGKLPAEEAFRKAGEQVGRLLASPAAEME